MTEQLHIEDHDETPEDFAQGATVALVNPRAAPREVPPSFGEQLRFGPVQEPLNHRVFRFPARFHPPVARRLVELFSRPGEVVLDCFCGSGTVAVEASFLGRSMVATDIDPLSVMVAGAKTKTYDLDQLDAIVARLGERLLAMREADERLWGGFDRDICEADYEAAAAPLAAWIPALPNARHWFRRRVTIQMAAILSLLKATPSRAALPFLRLCFASIVRNASNADPVPVSGLEVTRHMIAREAAGRVVDPYTLMAAALRRALVGTREYVLGKSPGGFVRVAHADARRLSVRGTGLVDCTITSPPYLAAVDYYRRHTLETYWLGLTSSPEERLALLPSYLGRDRVAERHLSPGGHQRGRAAARKILDGTGPVPVVQRRALIHYCDGMAAALDSMLEVARPGAPAVVVVGDVRFRGGTLPMADLFVSLAPPGLVLERRLWYPLLNRFMSYERQNSANIDAEQVLVFRVDK